MVTVTTAVERRSGVSYVVATVDNRIEAPAVDAHDVELSAAVAPIWTASEQRRPQWRDGMTTVAVPVGTVTGVGFATPTECPDEPVEVQSVRPAVDEEPERPATPGAILRALGDPRPPRDAVPAPTIEGIDSEDSEDERACDESGRAQRDKTNLRQRTPGRRTHGEQETAEEGGCRTTDSTASGRDGSYSEPLQAASDRELGYSAGESGSHAETAVSRAPAPVERWLARVDRRIEQDSQAAIAADRAHLRRVSQEVEQLLARVSE